MADISTITNISSDAIKKAEDLYSKVYNPVINYENEEGNTFSKLLSQAVDNINTTNAYLSDAENEQIRWALGQTDNTHELTIALNKATTAFQYTVAVRYKVLAAYNSLMQMQF